jgi:hypothetical protein
MSPQWVGERLDGKASSGTVASLESDERSERRAQRRAHVDERAKATAMMLECASNPVLNARAVFVRARERIAHRARDVSVAVRAGPHWAGATGPSVSVSDPRIR